jgi:hypothetical protein
MIRGCWVGGLTLYDLGWWRLVLSAATLWVKSGVELVVSEFSFVESEVGVESLTKGVNASFVRDAEMLAEPLQVNFEHSGNRFIKMVGTVRWHV